MKCPYPHRQNGSNVRKTYRAHNFGHIAFGDEDDAGASNNVSNIMRLQKRIGNLVMLNKLRPQFLLHLDHHSHPGI